MADKQTDKSVRSFFHKPRSKAFITPVEKQNGHITFWKSRTPAWIYKEVVQAFIKQGLFFVVKPSVVKELSETVRSHGYKSGFRVKYIRRFDSDAVEINVEFKSHGGVRSTLLTQFKHGRNYDGAY